MFYDSFTPLIILIWIVSWILSTVIGAQKGQGCLSSFVGFVLGPIGLIAALISRGNMVKCRYCQKSISKKAIVCPYCRSQVMNAFRQPQPPTQENSSFHKPQTTTQGDSSFQQSQPLTQDNGFQQPQTPNQDTNSSISGSSLQAPATKKIHPLLIVGIVLAPYIFVWFLFQKGYSKQSRIIAVSYLAIMALLAFKDDIFKGKQVENSHNTSIGISAEEIIAITDVKVINNSETWDTGISLNINNKSNKAFRIVRLRISPMDKQNQVAVMTNKNDYNKPIRSPALSGMKMGLTMGKRMDQAEKGTLVEIVETIEPNHDHLHKVQNIWFYEDIAKARINDIEIEFMDGTKEIITQSRVNQVIKQ
jgi:DNA-directed RNA polymerase subunit RPC12/RpoP